MRCFRPSCRSGLAFSPPAAGALVGAVFLGQMIGLSMWVAVACVTIAAIGVTLSDKHER